MNKSNLKLEILKFEYSIIRDKLLLFMAFILGSLFSLEYLTLPFIGRLSLYLVIIFSLLGFIVNLKEFNKISKEIKELINS